MTQPKLAPSRKRPRRVARKVWQRFGIAHHRDVPRGWHCPDCLPVFDLDDEQTEVLDRCMAVGRIAIVVTITTPLNPWPPIPNDFIDAMAKSESRSEAIRKMAKDDGFFAAADEPALITRNVPGFGTIDMKTGRAWWDR
jgi:hypothetical protein